MARILITSAQLGSGGGHFTYIEALKKISDGHEHVFGVAASEQSRIYRYLFERAYPFLYSCNFPDKIRKNLQNIIVCSRRFRNIVSDFKPDIVHTNGGPDLFIATWSRPFSRKYRIVRTHHSTKVIADNLYYRWIYNKVTEANIYVSKSQMQLSTFKGIYPVNSVIIENGVDLDRFSPSQKNALLSEKYGIHEDVFCFGSCAGTSSLKRVDTIIKAASLINPGKKFKILVVGDEPAGKWLQKIADELKVDQFVYCGFHNDIVPFISLFDVGFILSDSFEACSFAQREMVAMGKPLISSSFSGLKENVLNGSNGYLVQPGNVDDVASAMKKFLKMNKDTLYEFSGRAREYAVTHFDIKNQVKAHALLYESIIG